MMNTTSLPAVHRSTRHDRVSAPQAVALLVAVALLAVGLSLGE